MTVGWCEIFTLEMITIILDRKLGLCRAVLTQTHCCGYLVTMLSASDIMKILMKQSSFVDYMSIIFPFSFN